MYRKSISQLICTSLLVSIMASSLLIAQDDFGNEASDFDAPPPGVFDSEAEASDEEIFGSGNKAPFDPTNSTPPSSINSNFNESVPGSGPSNPAFNAAKKRQAKVSFADAEPEDVSNENFPDLIESFDFPNAEIADVVKAISELTGKNFIIDPSVSGKITIIAPSRITKAEAYKAFLSALAMKGFTIVPSGKFLKIKPARNSTNDNLPIYSGDYAPDTDQLITRIIHLKHINSQEFNSQTQKLFSANGSLYVHATTNSIIITDYGSNVQRFMEIIKQLDVPGFEEKLEVIPIRFAKAKDISELIDQIINKGEKKNSRTGGSFSAGIPRFNRAGDSANQAFSLVIPDDRTNSIIVVGNQTGIAKIRQLVKRLDFRLNPEDSGGVYVYYMKYGEAKSVAEMINNIVKDQKEKKDQPGGAMGGLGSINSDFPLQSNFPAMSAMGEKTSSGNLFGTNVKVTYDETINSLIITSNKQDYEAVKSLLKKIDIPRNQVNVEAIIMELLNSNKDARNLSYYRFAEGGLGRVGFSNSSDNLTTFLNPVAGSGSILTFAGGKDVTITDQSTGQDINVKSLMGFINFLKSVTDVNILSTPHITAMDNEEAEIEVGEKVPVGLSTTASATGSTNSVERENVSIFLKIKPRISPGSNSVRLEIEQRVAELSATQIKAKNLADSSQVTSERKIKTNIMVDDRDTAVLGGLIKEKEENSISKVPLLGDIPVLGWLFKSSNVEKQKTNMVMFITPNIIRNSEDQREIRENRLSDRLEFIKRNSEGIDPHGKKVDKILKSAPRPVASANDPEPEILTPAAPSETQAPQMIENNDSPSDELEE